MESPQTDDVLSLFLDLWRCRRSALADYLLSRFELGSGGYDPATLRLALMQDGSCHPENIGHIFARVWALEGGRAVEMPLGHESKRWYDPDSSGRFYATPSWLFVHEGREVLLSERYASDVKHRSLGLLSFVGGRWSSDWATVWHTSAKETPAVRNGSGEV